MVVASQSDPARRAALNSVKLRALVRDHIGHDVVEQPGAAVVPFGRGAALVADGTAWVLLDEQPERGLGAALAWLSRQAPVERLALLADQSSGLLARRAPLFATPIEVWHVVERLLVPAVAEPHPVDMAVDPAHEPLRELIIAGGAEPLVEHGVLRGEVRGLEVCRAVTDAFTGEVRLEVGVGAHDREAFLMLHGARPTVEALSEVAERVRGHREMTATPHPLNRFGAERFLRWRCLTEPSLIGAAALRPADPPVVRTNVKDPVPCVATGTMPDGTDIVAVFSTGIDLDLVPFAVDARAMHSPSARLALVVPVRDESPITRAVAAMVIDPPSLLGL